MKWKMKKLGDNLIRHRNDFIIIDDTKEYARCRVRTSAKGIVLRDFVSGWDIKTKRQQVCKKGEFLVAEIDAKMGGYGIVPEKLDGAIVSSHYFLYEINEKLLVRDFLNYYSKTRYFFEQINAQGSTNYASIRPHYLLEYKIPLPPLSEQKRLVTKLDAIKSRIKAIQDVRAEQEREMRNYRNCVFIDLLQEELTVPIGNILIPKRVSVDIEPFKEYKQITVQMNHSGVTLRGYKLGKDIHSKQYLANENDFIISKIDARNASMGIVPEELDNAVVTNDFPLFNLRKDVLLKYFDYFTNTYYFDEACKVASEGSTNRRRLKKEKFESILMPLPSLKKQQEILKRLDYFEKIRTLNIAMQQDLEALLPSMLDKAFKGEL